VHWRTAQSSHIHSADTENNVQYKLCKENCIKKIKAGNASPYFTRHTLANA